MATTTTNYGLTKPSYGDNADIAVINSNMDKIDAKMKEIEDAGGGRCVLPKQGLRRHDTKVAAII